MNRRNFLKIAGSTAVILAAGGAGFALTRTPTRALEAWESAGSIYEDPLRRAFSYAILAPNPHNRQPWIVDLKSDNEAVLTCDLDRLLPATDPFSRQIVIGLGCFLELFSLAAADQGYEAEIRYFPDGEPASRLDQRAIARIKLNKSATAKSDPLYGQVLNRHTNRNPYDTARPIADDLLDRLGAAAGTKVRTGATNEKEKLAALRLLTRDAMRTEMRTPSAHMESVNLIRIGKAEIEANPDGISLGGALLETLQLAGVLSRESLADPTSSAYQSGIDISDAGAMSAMAFVWINTLEAGRVAEIEAGRAYMRIALQAAADGLAMQPMSQALQEYPEMKSHFSAVHESLTSVPGERVQMLARLGYADAVGPSPRWQLSTRMKTT